jgi:hypothetical protein
LCHIHESGYAFDDLEQNSSSMKHVLYPSVHSRFQRFADITEFFIAQGNLSRVKHCLSFVEDLYNKGDIQTRNAIANIYVFSVSTYLETRRYRVGDLFPESLKAEYYKQVNSSCI